jgi:small subunit ribosomal protein S2
MIQVRFQDDYYRFLDNIKYDPQISIRELLEVGVHFGHNTSKWNPKMAPYIFGERNGIHIINIQKTQELMTRACKFAYYISSQGGIILFVGTKNIGREIVKTEAINCGSPYVVSRWLGGTLTNFYAILNGIERYNRLRELVETGEVFKLYTKKEANRIKRVTEKFGKYYERLQDLKRLPDALFVIGVKEEKSCVAEAVKMKIPIIAPVDTNCDPEPILFHFPGNDDAIRAVKFYCTKISEAIRAGRAKYEEEKRLKEELEQKVS